MTKRSRKPVVGVVASHHLEDGVHRVWLRCKYLDALREHSGVEPLLLPTLSGHAECLPALARLDGLLLTGDESNIDPNVFSGLQTVGPDYEHLMRDRYRDWAAQAALKSALQLNLPIFGICRGLQELNLIFGGTLHQNLREDELFMNHVEDTDLPRDRQYDPIHKVTLHNDGRLLRLLNAQELAVNSLHNQGIAQLAGGLQEEAIADDGLIEAASVRNAKVFQLAVQWHPEWHARTDAASQKIFAHFGEQCDRHQYRSVA